MSQETTEAPLLMRLWRWIGLPIIRDMDMLSEWGRAKPGEKWACLCGSLLGRGFMWPMWRVSK